MRLNILLVFQKNNYIIGKLMEALRLPLTGCDNVSFIKETSTVFTAKYILTRPKIWYWKQRSKDHTAYKQHWSWIVMPLTPDKGFYITNKEIVLLSLGSRPVRRTLYNHYIFLYFPLSIPISRGTYISWLELRRLLMSLLWLKCW